MATSVQFYHLTSTPLERALPRLLEKAVAGKYRTLLVAESDARVEQLNQLLWTYDPGSFLPHGSTNDGNPEQQPVLISSDQHPANQANLLFIINGTMASQTGQFERILDVFDGRNSEAVDNARERWKEYKNLGLTVTYMAQTATGGWEQKT